MSLAASYARKSTADMIGIEDQHAINARVAREDGVRVPEGPTFRFSDDDTSGVAERREGLDALIKLVETGAAPFHTIYVKDGTRLGRWSDPRFRHWLEVHLELHGVRLRYAEDAAPIDYRTAEPGERFGHFMKSAVDSIVASEERSRLIRRVKTALRSRLLRGLYPGSRAPYGLTRQLVDIHTRQAISPTADGVRPGGTGYRLVRANNRSAEVVERIFAWAEAGQSMRQIAEQLNREQTPSPRERTSGRTAVPWSTDGVRAVLSNPIYAGRLIWGGKVGRSPAPVQSVDLMKYEGPVLVEGMLSPALITDEQWHRVQALLAGTREHCRGRRTGRPAFLLSALLTCVRCGAPFSGHTSTAREGKQRRYYKHSRALPQYRDCHARRTYLRTDALDQLIVEQVERWLESDVLIKLLEQELDALIALEGGSGPTERRRELERRLGEAEAASHRAAVLASQASEPSLQGTYEEVAREQATRAATCRAALLELGEAALHLERARRRLNDRQRTWLQPLQLWRDADEVGRKDILRSLLRRIDVDADGGTCGLILPAP
jgi:DNA invertase Pin-like site-specific DNA recombinase